MSYIEELKQKVSKQQLEELYCNQLLSRIKCAETLGITYNAVINLIREYNLIQDKHAAKSKSNSEVKNRYYNQVKERISKEILVKYYIQEDHSYDDTYKHFGISEWIFDRLLKEYNIKKDRKETSKKSVKTRIEKGGGVENYNKQQKEKSDQTKIEKYGSLEAYSNYISSKCQTTWKSLPEQLKKERAQITLSHGGGWNQETIKQTLITKYGVDNAYKLADHYQTNSKVNQEFANKLDQNKIAYLREKNYNNLRYDFQVGNCLIEIDPWPFHNLTFCPIKEALMTDKNYHKYKTNNAVKNGFRCIHIFDWDDSNKIVELLKPKLDIYARKCTIKEISRDEAKEFLNTFHLQGYARDSIRLGLYFDNELVSVMTFGKPRYNKKYEYELVRYAYKCNIVGGVQKLFKYFVTTYNPISIISYCDLSKFVGLVYPKLGFKLKSVSQPTKHWLNIKTGKHITDNLLRQQGFDRLLGKEYGTFGKGSSNEELMRRFGFVEIYDCGQATYVWQN